MRSVTYGVSTQPNQVARSASAHALELSFPLQSTRKHVVQSKPKVVLSQLGRLVLSGERGFRNWLYSVEHKRGRLSWRSGGGRNYVTLPALGFLLNGSVFTTSVHTKTV
ncbi:hypothetical protein J6590_035781 [Homalodisca vitripennis]|nr:hypothetical protein J6590_035781 [Homalodisca vitripennis]